LQQLPSLTDTPEAFSKAVDVMQQLAEIGMVAADAVREEGMTPELEAEINEMYAKWDKQWDNIK
jgi:hypothetical protein